MCDQPNAGLRAGERTAEIAGPFAGFVHGADSGAQPRRRLGLAETGLEQLRDALDSAERVGLVLAGDIGRRAVDRLEPGNIEASSERMSPNMFSVSTTSNEAGSRSKCMAAASTYMWSSSISG